MRIIKVILFLFLSIPAISQLIPNGVENVDYIVTSGGYCSGEFGDNDHIQSFFLLIPKKIKKEFYLRIFDADCYGKVDEINGDPDSEFTFSFYGGSGCYSEGKKSDFNTTSGIRLKKLYIDSTYTKDQNWETLGPFRPEQGEFNSLLNGYIFRITTESKSGNDVNLYRYFISSEANSNIKVPGANAFTYDYCFRLKSSSKSIGHVFPFVDSNVVTISQQNFDFDADGSIRIFSKVKNGELGKSSADNEWASSIHRIQNEERGKSLDLQVIKSGSWHNDMTFVIKNQYGQRLPFFSIPIGGVPKFQHKVNISR